jgi:magnesium-transporting ATPase (P-type)
MDKNRQEDIKDFAGKHPFGLWVIMGLQLLNVVALVAETLLSDREWLPVWVGIMPAFNSNANIFLFLLAIIGLFTLVGLWFHRPWGWYLTMIQVGANLATMLFLYFNNTPQYISMIINVAIVFYLNQINIRYDIFQENKSTTAL